MKSIWTRLLILGGFLAAILGGFAYFANPTPTDVDQFERAIARIEQHSGNKEVYALLFGGGMASEGEVVITVENGSARLQYKHEDGTDEVKDLQREEWDEFSSFIRTNRIDRLKHWNSGDVLDGIEYVYLHLSQGNKKLLYMNNPEISAEGSSYDLLVREFLKLIDREHFAGWD